MSSKVNGKPRVVVYGTGQFRVQPQNTMFCGLGSRYGDFLFRVQALDNLVLYVLLLVLLAPYFAWTFQKAPGIQFVPMVYW